MAARTRRGAGRRAAGLLVGLSMVLVGVWKGPLASAHKSYCRQPGAAFVPVAVPSPSPLGGGFLPVARRHRTTELLTMTATGEAGNQPAQEVAGLFATTKKKTAGEKTQGKKKVVKSKSTTKTVKSKAAGQKQQPAGRRANYQRQTLQRDDSWDLVDKQPIPVSSLVVGGGALAAVGGYFGQKWWTKRHATLITEFVDDMMDAGTDKRSLAKTVVNYKSKLGPFATPRLLREYLKVVFRAPDLSPSFVEAMDYVVNSLLRVKEDELFSIIAEVTKDMGKAQEFVGMSILLFTFERILPANVAVSRLEPIRRVLSKVFPGDVADHMFDLAKDAYSLEIEMMYKRMEPPLVLPSGWEALGLREKDAQEVFKKIKAEYEPPASVLANGGDLSQTLIVRKRDPIHDMIYGRAEDICDKHISGYKEEKEKKKQEKNRGRPLTWDETVTRISRMVLTKEGEEVINSLQKFQCLRCQRLTTLMPGETEEEVFTADYECPQCKGGRDMVVRRQ